MARGGRPVVRDVSLEIPPRRGHRAARPQRRRQVEPRARGRAACCAPAGGKVTLGADDLTCTAAGADPPGRRGGRARGPAAAAGADRARTTSRVATYALSRESEAKAGLKRALELFPELEKRLDVPGALALGRRAADARARPGARVEAEVRAHRRALARPRAGGGQAADADDPRGRRGGRRRAADRAVRHGRARPRRARVRDGGRPDPVLGDGQRAEGEPRAAALGLSAARQRRAERRAWPRPSLPAARDRGRNRVPSAW